MRVIEVGERLRVPVDQAPQALGVAAVIACFSHFS
jgi:hypothetical protein